MSEILTPSDLKREIWNARGPDKTQKDWADENSFSSSFISAVIAGRKKPSKRLLDLLGLVAIEAYKRKEI